MATATTSLICYNDTDANFRAWGSWISGRFSEFGWVQTADSGQINWTTVLKPAAINTAQGYEIWRMNDALQATSPCYVKIEYGSTGAANYPGIWLTVGDGSNGSGTITGSPVARRQFGYNAANASLACHASGDTNRIAFLLWHNGATPTSAYQLFGIERSHDASGNDTAAGLLVLACENGTGGFHSCYFETGVGTATPETSPGALLPSVGTLSAGSLLGFSPIFVHDGGGFVNPALNFVLAFATDISLGSSVVLPMYGADHTFMAPGGDINITVRGTIANNVVALVRYE